MEENEFENENSSIVWDGVEIPKNPFVHGSSSSLNDSRLLITEIRCTNFKSYGGVRILGPFHSRFSSIVGPNGSGKSNVIDAMLFVFGYRAQKIRSKKLSVLIHESNTISKAEFCSVSVIFKRIENANENESHIPNSEINISRFAFRDNSSYYELDGRRKPFKEIGSLLRTFGIDLDHSRFLILQGEVEQIACLKPLGSEGGGGGMLEYLEDIIGSSRLKEPLETFKSRVVEIEEKRGEKLNRVKIVEREKDELEGAKNEALHYLSLENEIIEIENQKLQRSLHFSNLQVNEAEVKKREFEKEVQELLTQISEASNQKKASESQCKEMTLTIENLDSEIESFKDKFNGHENEDKVLMEDLKNTNSRRKKLKGLLGSEKEKIESLLSIPGENGKKIEECTTLKSKIESLLSTQQNKLDEALGSLKVETMEIVERKEKAETKLMESLRVLNEAKAECSLVTSELEIEELRDKKEKDKLESLTHEKKDLEESCASLTKEIKDLESSAPKKQKELKDLEESLRGLSEKISTLSKSVQSHRVKYEEIRSALSASKDRGRVISGLLEQRANGNIPGILGRLGDLGSIHAKYDVAVSTVGGSSLDTIIVDSVETGKTCIQFLRDTDLGRANFLALDKTNVWIPKTAPLVNSPENAPRLFDLVSVSEPRFKPCFYHVLRETLVAKNMEQAQRLAFGASTRYKVVTLTGDVIEVSGAMCGGGKDRISGKMGTSTLSSHYNSVSIAEEERNVETQSALLSEALASKASFEQRSFELVSTIEKNNQTLRSLSLSLSSKIDKLSSVSSLIISQGSVVKSVKRNENKIRQLKESLNTLQKKYEGAQSLASNSEAKVTDLDNEIKELYGHKINRIKEKLEETKTKLTKVKKEITRYDVGIKSSERDIEKSKDKIQGLENEIKEAEEGMRAMKETRDGLEVIGKKIFEDLKGLLKKKDTLEKTYQDYKGTFETLFKREKNLLSSQIEITQKIEFYSKSIKEEKARLCSFQKALSKLKYREIPMEENEKVLYTEVVSDLTLYPSSNLEELDLKKLEYRKTVLEEELSSVKPNYGAIAEFKRKESLYLIRVNELEELTKEQEKQKSFFETLRKMRLQEFLNGFSIITNKLKEMYQMITLGGDAELELVDSLDPFSEGIVFSVRPPKKSWKNISNLSGGEKTLSSLALVFALHYYKPSPLYVMDEIDAALDFKNVSIVANYIRERTRNAQFIIISLRSNMFELADRLVGIYKTHNVTKSITIDPKTIAGL